MPPIYTPLDHRIHHFCSRTRVTLHHKNKIKQTPLFSLQFVLTEIHMADTVRSNNVDAANTRTQPSRLQRRRPASLQINPTSSSHWNAAIPLLSPLISSPTAIDRTVEMKSKDEQLPPPQPQQQRNQSAEADKPPVFKKWQHPAAPFYYEPGPFAPSFFVPVQKFLFLYTEKHIVEIDGHSIIID